MSRVNYRLHIDLLRRILDTWLGNWPRVLKGTYLSTYFFLILNNKYSITTRYITRRWIIIILYFEIAILSDKNISLVIHKLWLPSGVEILRLEHVLWNAYFAKFLRRRMIEIKIFANEIPSQYHDLITYCCYCRQFISRYFHASGRPHFETIKSIAFANALKKSFEPFCKLFRSKKKNTVFYTSLA